MVRIALLPVLAAASAVFAAPLVTYQTIVGDVNAINAGVQQFRADLANYNGGAIQQTPLVADFTAIEVANRKGYADANAAAPFTASGSTAIVNDVIATVGNTIPASINELNAKKPLFAAAGDVPLIKATLQTLLYDHETFSAAVAAKLTADQAAGAAVISEIAAAIQNGIDYYSTN